MPETGEGPKGPGPEEESKSKEESFEGVLNDEKLLRLAKLIGQARNQVPERLKDFLKQGDDWYAAGEVPEEEWAILAGSIQKKLDSIPVSDPFEAFKGIPIEEERARWVDVEYRQEFYTRFTPSMEPRFYRELKEKERELFDARWQLARAAYFKKAYTVFPEKMVENQDLTMLSMEQMEKLYNMAGVKQAIEWYADVVVNRKSVFSDGRTIWECRNEIEFEEIRQQMRDFLKEKVGINDEKTAKEADAVAWNWMWVSNLIESLDSRYFFNEGGNPKYCSGKRHDNLPGFLASDDLRAVFHPQEYFEDTSVKGLKGREFGVFGKWGINQMEEIKREVDFKKEDEFRFKSGASPNKYWQAERTIDKTEKGGNYINVFAPECYPTIPTWSFWEEIEWKGKNLLEHLLSKDKEGIEWREISSAFWAKYLPVNVNKAVLVADYFKGKVPFKETEDVQWVTNLLNAFSYLKLEERLGKEVFHNLKSWCFRASLGGVKKPHWKHLTPPPGLKQRDLVAYTIRLRSSKLRYLQGSPGGWAGEGLEIQ